MNKPFYQLFLANLWNLTWPWLLCCIGMAVFIGFMMWHPIVTFCVLAIGLFVVILCAFAYDQTKSQIRSEREDTP